MPPRLQPPPASGTGRPRAAVLPLALLLSLALQGVAAAPAGAGEPEDSLRRQDPELPRGLLEQAARAALHFVNFRAGSPSTLRVLADVLEGRARVSAGATRRRTVGAVTLVRALARPAADPRVGL